MINYEGTMPKRIESEHYNEHFLLNKNLDDL